MLQKRARGIYHHRRDHVMLITNKITWLSILSHHVLFKQLKGGSYQPACVAALVVDGRLVQTPGKIKAEKIEATSSQGQP